MKRDEAEEKARARRAIACDWSSAGLANACARFATPYFAAVLALALLTALAFSNSFSTGFALDNQLLILGDTRIRPRAPPISI